MFFKLTYNRALPDIWRSNRGNEKSLKNTYIYIYIYIYMDFIILITINNLIALCSTNQITKISAL